MNKYLKKGLLVLFVVIITGSISIIWVFRSTQNIRFTKADYEITAPNLLTDFILNEELANKKYIGKIIVVEGIIKDIDQAQSIVFLQTDDEFLAISCCLSNKQKIHLNNISKNYHVKIKGECSGILIDVNLNNCLLLEIVP